VNAQLTTDHKLKCHILLNIALVSRRHEIVVSLTGHKCKEKAFSRTELTSKHGFLCYLCAL